MPKLGLIVLSSISEALPLVILEGYAAACPAWPPTSAPRASNWCSGWARKTRRSGAAGDIVRIADPTRARRGPW